MAHELGHALGLLHRQNFTNLMASGTTGAELNESEIKNARFAAKKFSWIESAPQMLKAAQELDREGKAQQAHILRQRLDGLLE